MRLVLILLTAAGLVGCAATPPATTPAPVDFRGAAPAMASPAPAPTAANVTRIEVASPAPAAAEPSTAAAPPPAASASITSSPLPPPETSAPPAAAPPPPPPVAAAAAVPQGGPDPRALRADIDPLNPPATITVNQDESLWDIAEIFKVPLRALIDANTLAPPYAVEPGQTIAIPPPRQHVVQTGETLFQIAQRYSIDQRSLAVYNRLERPFNVRVGQRIALPALARDRFAGLEPQDLAAVLSGREQATSARRPAAMTAEAASAAAIAAGAAGATAPATTAATATAPLPVRPPAPSVPRPPALQPGPAVPTAPPAPAPAPTAGVARPSGPPTIALSFQWPVEGEIIETFGPKQGGRRNDGVNIAAPEGAPFRAAAAGEVAYAGNEIPGYGWLVLVRHEGGIITAYAHARALKVAEGDRVRAGQVLGEVGASGRVNRPQLHFEIRRGVTPVDPLRELPRRAGS